MSLLSFLELNLFKVDFPTRPQDCVEEAFETAYFSELGGIFDDPSEACPDTALSHVTSFFGLPFFNFGKQSKQNAFLASLFGWNQAKYPLALNILRAFFIFPINIVLIIPRFLLNVLKLFTEFLPGLLARLTGSGINWLIEAILLKSYSKKAKFFMVISLGFLFLFHFICKVAHLIGRAITSPHKSLYAAWEAGEELGGNTFLGKMASVFFCLISLVVTVSAYVILFPIAIKLVAAVLSPTLTSGITSALQFLSPLSNLGAPLSAITTPIFQAMGSFFAGTPSVILGVAMLTGITAGPLGVLWEQISNKISKFLMKNSSSAAYFNPSIHPTLSVPKNFLPKWLELNNLLASRKVSQVYTAKYSQYSNEAINIIAKVVFDQEDFKKEVGVMAKLGTDSPYIVYFYGVCKKEKYKHIILMEYVDGCTLSNCFLHDHYPNWGMGRYRIALDVAYALKYLHSKFIIHADIKCDNILVTEATGFHAKVIDFNLSGMTDEASLLPDETFLRGTRGGVGTAGWMAPEVKRPKRESPTQASDIFSYGMVLWAMGTKKIPRPDLYDEAVEDDAYEPAQLKIAKNTPNGVAALIQRCWYRNPLERPKAVAAVEILEEEAKGYGCSISPVSL